ncbi:hypothetical protein EON77_08810 [bacterium]|nr:MAG: hypothetical protein EON77_08810 [bacterium]
MRAAEALVPFGFTALESEVYAFLLKENPATGYRIAQAIGKPAANTYKAIASLERKGALSVEDGESRQCVPVAPAALLGRLAKRYEADQKGALAALKKAAVPPAATARLTTIHGTESALGAARAMLGAARVHVLLHAHADLLEALAPEIEAAAPDAPVYILGAESVEIAGVEWIPARGKGDEGYVLEMAVDTSSGILATAADAGGELVSTAISNT